jgi:AsmA protein
VRRWLAVPLAVVLLLGLALALAARNLDVYVNANREALARRAAEALGREVAFGEIGISLRGGLAVRVADLRVADDPSFSRRPFLRAEALEVRVRLLPALRGRIEVERVVLRSPEVSVIETARGFSTATLGRSAAPRGAGQAAEPPASGALLVALVDVADGTLRYVDETSRPPLEAVAHHVDFRASDLTPEAPVAFEMAAAVLGAKRQNLRASGSVGPAAAEPRVDVALELAPLDLATALRAPALARALPEDLAGSGEARVELRARGTPADLALDARLDARDAELRLGTGLAKPKGRPLALSLRGRRRASELEIEQADLVVDETRLAATGTVEDLASPKARFRVTSPAVFPASLGAGAAGDAFRDLALEGSLSLPSSGAKLAASLRSPAGSVAGVDYRDLALEARWAGGRIELRELALAAHQGSLAATGSADLRAPAGPAFEATLEIDGMRLESVLSRHAPPAAGRASGRVAARLALRGVGASFAAIAPTLAGDGEVSVADGVLRDFNPAGDALRAIAVLPVLEGAKLRGVLAAHPQVFGVEDTPFESLRARLEIRGREVLARDARLLASGWDVTGDGRYALEGRLDSTAVMAFSPDLSDELLAAVPKLRFLRSSEGRVAFPVAIRGTPGRIAVEPDLAYIARSASREALAGALERALVGKRRAEPEPGEGGAAEGADGEPAPPASPEEVGRELLRRGLEGLLGGRPED